MATTPLRFIGFGVAAFIVASLMNVFGSLMPVSQVTDLTWFTAAKSHLNNYGFFAMVMFGAVYWIVPQLLGAEFCSAKLVRAHFWLAAIGVVLIVVPLGIGGLVQGFKLQDANLPFVDVAKATLPFLRASTMGDLLLAAGHLIFLLNLGGLAWKFYRSRAVSAYTAVTADMIKAGVQS
jgi:cytochrome c oxidase cbb3-type subunit 1